MSHDMVRPHKIKFVESKKSAEDKKMRIRKYTSKVTIVLAVSICLGAVSAHAAKPGNPPKDSGRDVIGDAAAICGTSSAIVMLNICKLRNDSNGTLNGDEVCDPLDPAGIGSEGTDVYVADYYLRNCGKNEASMVRTASSAVLSYDDVVTRGKDQQITSAANYLCAYATKHDQLVGMSKLFATRDLGADARDLADAISGVPSYCDL